MSRAKKIRAGKKSARSQQNNPIKGSAKPFPYEWLGFALIALLVAAALAVSWRKWPDPLVDFGRELYLPWQITQGAVLYRDIDANYGPLSHYFNALVFLILGPGFMHLVTVNLTVYGGILTLLYRALRIGWGITSAFVGSVIFVTVFSFNQFVGIGNYNFAAPYSHETTHGFLLILALVCVWCGWLRRPRLLFSGLTGFLCGLSLLLKLEIIFTAALVTIGAIVLAGLSFREIIKPRDWTLHATAFVLAGALPPLIATGVLYQTGRFTLIDAFLWANCGWSGLFLFKNITSDPTQAVLSGFSDITGNLTLLATAGGLSFIAFAGLALLFKYIGPSRQGLLLTACLVASGAAFFISLQFPWTEAGRVFPVWLLAGSILLLFVKSPPSERSAAQMQCLLLIAAWAFLARMALNPRIYHYGYFQAALAGVLTVVIGWKMIPDLFRLQHSQRLAYCGCLALFLASGLWQLQQVSTGIYAKKTQPLGVGSDQILGFDARIEPTTALLEDARTTLANLPDCHRLLVLPEGIILNYLLRKNVATHVYMFNPYWLKWQSSVLENLKTTPPDYVLLISRDMREFGMGRFGDSEEHGAPLLAWIDWNCTQVREVGGDPLDVTQRGAILFQRKHY